MPVARNESPMEPMPPWRTRPIKYLWAATLTGAVISELAATSAGPVAEFVRAVLRSAGVYVELRGPKGASGYSAVCQCEGQLEPLALPEESTGDRAPADQRVTPPAVGP